MVYDLNVLGCQGHQSGFSYSFNSLEWVLITEFLGEPDDELLSCYPGGQESLRSEEYCSGRRGLRYISTFSLIPEKKQASLVFYRWNGIA